MSKCSGLEFLGSDYEELETYQRMAKISQMDPMIFHKVCETILDCTECRHSGGNECPTDVVFVVEGEAHNRRVAYDEFGDMWYRLQSSDIQ